MYCRGTYIKETHNNSGNNITQTNIGPYIKTHNLTASQEGENKEYISKKSGWCMNYVMNYIQRRNLIPS
jgi:hypothetical protein